jgi:hypothetical protein
MTTIRICAVALIAAATSAAEAATFADLSNRADPQAFGAEPATSAPYGYNFAAGGYGAGPYAARPADRGYSGGYGPLAGYVAQAGPHVPGPYAGEEARPPGSPFSGGPEGVPPLALDGPGMPPPALPTGFPPYGPGAGLPNGQQQLSTFQQVNSTTDPYNAWGLSTPYMFVPWSTPLSGWTNAQTWRWWRERSGASPYGW